MSTELHSCVLALMLEINDLYLVPTLIFKIPVLYPGQDKARSQQGAADDQAFIAIGEFFIVVEAVDGLRHQ